MLITKTLQRFSQSIMRFPNHLATLSANSKPLNLLVCWNQTEDERFGVLLNQIHSSACMTEWAAPNRSLQDHRASLDASTEEHLFATFKY